MMVPTRSGFLSLFCCGCCVCWFSSPINWWQYYNTNAFLGQKLEHLPHLIHLSWSTSGAPKSFWLRAPAGQTFTAGHLWSWGQFSMMIFNCFSIIFLSLKITSYWFPCLSSRQACVSFRKPCPVLRYLKTWYPLFSLTCQVLSGPPQYIRRHFGIIFPKNNSPSVPQSFPWQAVRLLSQ